MTKAFIYLMNFLLIFSLSIPWTVLPNILAAFRHPEVNEPIDVNFLSGSAPTKVSSLLESTYSDPDEDVRLIVQFRKDPLLQFTRSFSEGPGVHLSRDLAVSEYQQSLKKTHQLLIEALSSQKIPVQVHNEFSNLFNGLSLTIRAAGIDQLNSSPDIQAIYLDGEVQAHLNDSVPLIEANSVWNDYGVTGVGVTVAVIDTGVNYLHPDLGGCFGSSCKVIDGYDFANNDTNPMDDHGHGTHVAGIIGASGTITGVAPGVNLLAYKALDYNGAGYQSSVIASLDAASNPDGDPLTDDGADVANLSLGGFGFSNDPLVQAVNNAALNGMVVVVSAGNNGPDSDTIESPGIAAEALTVGSSSKTDQLTSYSSRGPAISSIKPSLLAPGDLIVSTGWVPNTPPTEPVLQGMSGTSMAAPHVAGAAALLRALHPEWDRKDLESALINTARSLQLPVYLQGSGRVNVGAAARAAVSFSPSLIDFGWVDQTQNSWEKSIQLEVTNLTTQSVPCTSSVAQPLPAGMTLNSIPASFELQPESMIQFSIQASLNMAVVTTGNIGGEVRISCDNRMYRVPFGMVITPENHHIRQVIADSSAGWFSHAAYINRMDGTPGSDLTVTYSILNDKGNLLVSADMLPDASVPGKWISETRSMHVYGFGYYQVRTRVTDSSGRQSYSEDAAFQVGIMQEANPSVIWDATINPGVYTNGLEIVDLDHNSLQEVVWMRSDGMRFISNTGTILHENTDQIFHATVSSPNPDQTVDLVSVGGEGHGMGGNLAAYAWDGQKRFSVPAWSDTAVAVCDLDGDGADDYIAGAYSGINVFSSDGILKWKYPLPAATHSLRLLGDEVDCSDLDADGKDELVIGYWSGDIYVLEDQTLVPVRNWYEGLDSGTTQHIMDVDAHEDGQAVAVGYGGTILFYNGTSWAPMNSGTTYTFRGISWRQDGKAIAVGDTGTVYHYDGIAWSKMNFPSYNSLESIVYRDDNTALAVGYGIFYFDGTSWSTMMDYSGIALDGVTTCANGQSFAVGQGGTILRYNGTTWESMSSPTTAWLSAVACDSEGNAYAVGYGSDILRYDGTGWAALDRFGYFLDVDVNTSNQAVTVDSNGVATCTAAGCTITSIPFLLRPNPAFYYGVATYGSSSYFVTGSNGNSIRFSPDQHLLWSHSIQYDVSQSVKVRDLDQDGHAEVIALGNRLCVFEDSGILDWCSMVPASEVDSYEAISIQDIHPSPGMEIIITKGMGDSSEMWSANGKLLWRQSTYLGGCFTTVHQDLGDINGDGYIEIVVASNSKAVVFSPFGSRLLLLNIPNGTRNMPMRLANLDSTEELELAVVSDSLYALSVSDLFAPVHADFTSSAISGVSPLSVAFTNTSTGAHSMYGWDFGDGSPISTEANPTHVYQTGGKFTVSLTASGPGGSDNETKIGIITVADVQVTVEPDAPASLVYDAASRGLISIAIPAGSVERTTVLEYTDVKTVDPWANFEFANHAFNIDAYQDNTLQTGFTFELPVSIYVHYTDQDVLDIDESTLQLNWWDSDLNTWGDAACGMYSRFPEDNWFSVPICHLSNFAVFGLAELDGIWIYLPLVCKTGELP